ncbi:translation elongation factor Ts [Alphaproteobacteria bacterium]|nr:translation elongation factor Ts [Alphaproteobacteria bacterium]
MSNMEYIKKLRDTTGSGIVDCKKALSENNNDIDAAIKWLREKGILKAQKKQDRETNEGVVSFYNNSSNTNFTVCKIKCETDFVAKNQDFLRFAESLSKAIHENKIISEHGNDEDLSHLKINNKPLKESLTDLISKIGENIQIVSYKKYSSEKSIFISYLHNKYNSSCSKIGSVVEISTDNKDIALKLAEKLKVIAMQISAMKPMGIDESSIKQQVLQDEKDIILKQMTNVPEDKKDQMIKGKLNKFLKENTLLGQALITDPKMSVSSFLSEVSKSNNISLNIASMDLYTI